MSTKGKILFCCFIVMLFLTGCKSVASPGELIKSPKPESVGEGNLLEKLEQLRPTNSEYLTPPRSASKQSVLIEDVNNDGRLEAFATYRSLGENRKVHLIVLQEGEGEDWDVLTDIETDYYTLDYFELQDLNEDTQMEVIIGLGTSDFESEKQLYIYEWKSDGINLSIEKGYDIVDIVDYDEDNQLDVLLVHGVRREFFTAELFHYQEGKLISKSAVGLDPYAFHEHVESGKLADDKQALFIDSAVGAHSMITQMVTFKVGQLIKLDEEFIKAYPLYSQDIDADGVIEVGGMYIPKGWEDAAFANIPFIEYFQAYSSDGTSIKKGERYTNREHRFYVEFPPEWNGRITIKEKDNGVQLLSAQDSKLIFDVNWTKKGTDEKMTHVLIETKDTVYYSTISENETFPFEQFHLLDTEL